MNWSLLGPLIVAGAQLVALVGAYYGLKADNAALRADLAIGLLAERGTRREEHADFKATVLASIASVEFAVRAITGRVGGLEARQDEWTKMLRARTHELANSINAFTLKVDRLERPPEKHE